ncbi:MULTISPECIES: 50S ribosomal protein L30 [unclassified Bdellovibrio]|uniref:50S ribosomal protein L30 n=1 Tax=unclassified Bdellovibrio TaxID=2633795 RepID=UPI0011588E1C|nr:MULTISPECIES: 50S ribosomal protein L30 [unclassified Bdellovibrio]QDK44387.1 50S ribosomal protein L30 [Bdellovibrio sp. ZAP7]QLY26212.1 50S ribosomal protein L30 [Bdellovibrio sp. KM01]
MAKTFIVKLKKSTIGCTQEQKDAVRCLGLKKVNSTAQVNDTPANRGQIMKVQHLVNVEVKG